MHLAPTMCAACPCLLAIPPRAASPDARALADNLGIQMDVLPIEGPYQSYLDHVGAAV